MRWFWVLLGLKEQGHMEVVARRYSWLSISSRYLHGSLAYSLLPFLLGRLLMGERAPWDEMAEGWAQQASETWGRPRTTGHLLGGPETVSVARPWQTAGCQLSLTSCRNLLGLRKQPWGQVVAWLFLAPPWAEALPVVLEIGSIMEHEVCGLPFSWGNQTDSLCTSF